jgi:hypothetical protein
MLALLAYRWFIAIAGGPDSSYIMLVNVTLQKQSTLYLELVQASLNFDFVRSLK